MGRGGVRPDDLHSVDDLWKAPSYSVHDIRRSIEEHPPWGDYQGVTPDMARREPMRVYMSGGTTGQSRPTFYTQWDREVGAVLMARQLYLQGIRPGDVVLNSWSYGTHIMDLSYLYPRERCECGSWMRRMAPFAGRGDNMVKLRGVNVRNWCDQVNSTSGRE